MRNSMCVYTSEIYENTGYHFLGKRGDRLFRTRFVGQSVSMVRDEGEGDIRVR